MADKDKNLIIWSSTIFDAGGYALMCRNYIRRLIDRGWNVKVEPIRSPVEIDQEEAQYFMNLCENPVKLPSGHIASDIIVDPEVKKINPQAKIPSPANSIRVIAHLPLVNVPKPPGGKRVIFTMMECEKVNDNFIHQRCNNFYEECWTPTVYNKSVFEEKGLAIPCKVAPIGVDEIYKEENAFDLNLNYKVYGDGNPDGPEGFVFLSVFRWSYRKGFDVLIKSFLKEFKKSDNVSLVIISRHAAMSHAQEFKDAIDHGIRTTYEEHATKDSPSIYWCGDVVPQDLMPSMYKIGDCFVSCSRGEGMGMPIMEASTMGLPIIAPFHTGFTDYLRENNSNLFYVDEWVKCNDIPEWNQGWITAEFFGQNFPKFGDETVSSVRELMRKVKENPEEAIEKNKKLQEVLEKEYSWESCVDRLEKYLEEL